MFDLTNQCEKVEGTLPAPYRGLHVTVHRPCFCPCICQTSRNRAPVPPHPHLPHAPSTCASFTEGTILPSPLFYPHAPAPGLFGGHRPHFRLEELTVGWKPEAASRGQSQRSYSKQLPARSYTRAHCDLHKGILQAASRPRIESRGPKRTTKPLGQVLEVQIKTF